MRYLLSSPLTQNDEKNCPPKILATPRRAQIFDENGDGLATPKELFAVLSVFMKGEGESAYFKRVVRALFIVLDAGRSGVIECEELVDMTVKLAKTAVKALKATAALLLSNEVLVDDGGEVAAQLDEFFNSLDADKSGSVDLDELIEPFVKVLCFPNALCLGLLTINNCWVKGEGDGRTHARRAHEGSRPRGKQVRHALPRLREAHEGAGVREQHV